MTEMIERVARAILASLAKDGPADPGSGLGLRGVLLDEAYDLEEAARAAIEAMREPTEGMVTNGGGYYQSMIDAALAP